MIERKSSSFVSTLTTYVPRLVAEYLSHNPNTRKTPMAQTCQAALLFIEIEGLTMFVESLMHGHPHDPQTLGNAFNLYIENFIDQIILHGGDILNCSGDYLLASWTTEKPATNAHCAAECGFTIQKLFHKANLGDDIHFALRMAVGVGEMTVAHIGNLYQRWAILLTGSPFSQLTEALLQARPGKVVISSQAWSLIRVAATGERLAEDYIELQSILNLAHLPIPLFEETSSDAETALCGCVPRAILNRLLLGQTDWLAEVLPVNVLSLHLSDVNHTISPSQAQTLLCAVQAPLYGYQGQIIRLCVDSTGLTLTAAFGLPPFGNADDPYYTIQAGMAIQKVLKALCLSSAIGIASGRAFCGVIGSKRRREYAVIGNVVHKAWQLMRIAHDSILCDGATYQSANATMLFNPLPKAIQKGEIDPVYCIGRSVTGIP